MTQHTMDLTNVRSVRDLKAKLAAAEVLFDAKALQLEPGKNKIELLAHGTFIEAGTGEAVFCLSRFADVKSIGYSNFVIAPAPDNPSETYKVHMEQGGEYEFRICVIS